FISEEIWQRMAPLAGVEGKTIMRQPYPAPDRDRIDQQSLEEISWVKDFIIGVRKIRSGMNIDPRKLLPALLQDGSEKDRQRLDRNRRYLESVGRLEDVTWLNKNETAPESSTALVGDMKLLIPLAGLIDKESEILRLTKELEKKTSELDRCEKKLLNPGFVNKAPADVVEKERARAAELRSVINNLEGQKIKIQTL
ncbi:MAG: class I tRNA ligase family protein, partial [Xanthomonadales bacterium]|nr:class I tRNA ligase family protein [Xanthomonadales bacterium]